jgi:hypothetical protein
MYIRPFLIPYFPIPREIPAMHWVPWTLMKAGMKWALSHDFLTTPTGAVPHRFQWGKKKR